MHSPASDWPTCVSLYFSLLPCQGQSLSVNVSSPSSTASPALLLSPGDTLDLLCDVVADNLASLSLEVSWLADGRDVVTMDRGGVIISNASGAPRGRAAAATLERTDSGRYRLLAAAVSPKDSGSYSCRVRAFVERSGRSSSGGGRWHMAAERTSGPLLVKVAQISEYSPNHLLFFFSFFNYLFMIICHF